jgi:hypothetical protein
VSFAVIRGRNGRRHEVDFGDEAIEIDVAIGSETVQITVEAIHDQAPSDKRRFNARYLRELPLRGRPIGDAVAVKMARQRHLNGNRPIRGFNRDPHARSRTLNPGSGC